MQASEILRVAAALLNVGDEIPIAALPAALPHYLMRVTAICVERRQLGVLREFLLRGLAIGLSTADELSGFLGVRVEEVRTELCLLEEDFFVTRGGSPSAYMLMEKGTAAISVQGLPQTTEREAACYVNGVTRRVEQVSSELLPRRQLPAGMLVLPAVPARAPRVDELEVAGVKTSMLLARNALPRILEITRLGRVMRTTALFATGHLLLRKGVHGVPLICINGAADTDLAKPMGSHPALNSVKALLEKNEKQARLHLTQLRPALRQAKWDKPEAVHAALTRFVAWSDADAEDAVANSLAQAAFIRSAQALLEATHWISGFEVQVLFAAALVAAKKSLLIVVPQFPDCFGTRAFGGVQAAVRRGVKVELALSPANARAIENDPTYRAIFQGAELIPMSTVGEWCGFCVDSKYVVAGASRGDTTVLGRCDSFFGAVLMNEEKPEALLRDFAKKGGAVVTTKSRKRNASSPARGI